MDNCNNNIIVVSRLVRVFILRPNNIPPNISRTVPAAEWKPQQHITFIIRLS